MSGRYDFVKDPKDRRWIARWQVASVVMFVALLVARRPSRRGPAPWARRASTPTSACRACGRGRARRSPAR